jgi:hypothetical protein
MFRSHWTIIRKHVVPIPKLPLITYWCVVQWLFNPFNKGEQICSPLLIGLNNTLDDIFFDLFNITDMLLHEDGRI